jgi:hypothetical protein
MGSRTPDLLIANETLYQLSYDPIPENWPALRQECQFAGLLWIKTVVEQVETRRDGPL